MNKTTCVKTSCGNPFTWKKVLYKYTVREWRQNVLQNLLPFGNNLKKCLFLHLSLSLLTDGLQKVLLSRNRQRETKRDLHRQSLERRGRFCGAVKIIDRELASVHA